LLQPNFAAATKRFVDRTKHFVVVTKSFCYPFLTNDFVSITKPFFLCNTNEWSNQSGTKESENAILKIYSVAYGSVGRGV